MLCLKRNKLPFWYCQYEGKFPLLDKDGNETGEYEIRYSDPIPAEGNIHDVHDVRVGVKLQDFGVLIEYQKILIMEDENFPIDEYSLLWVDIKPEEGKPDYYIRKVSRSLNGVSYGIKRVTIS